MTEILKQPQYQPMVVEDQIISIYAGVNGYLDDIPLNEVSHFEHDFLKFMKANYAEIPKAIREKRVIDSDTEAGLKNAIKEFKDTFATYEKTNLEAAR